MSGLCLRVDAPILLTKMGRVLITGVHLAGGFVLAEAEGDESEAWSEAWEDQVARRPVSPIMLTGTVAVTTYDWPLDEKAQARYVKALIKTVENWSTP